MGDGWYYVGPEGRVGPITLQGLKASLATDDNPAGVVVWRENASQWECAADVPELRETVPAGVSILTRPTEDSAETPAKAAIRAERHYAAAGLVVVIVILLGCGLLYRGIW
jgi:hypothetical protein